MKPIDLYDAMEGIPEKYIEAAKPAVKRRGESRTVTEQTLRHAEAVSTESTSRPVQRSSHSRKDRIRMSTKQPVWQRIATAFAATAACAVFVGGGMFIVQQAKQNQQQEDSGKNVQSVQNFLG